MGAESSAAAPRVLRVAIVLPAPAPYREGLLAELHRRADLDLRVIYATAEVPSWDAGADWAPTEHPYPSLHLRSRQRARPGRTPVLWPRGLERALAVADPDVIVASEYGASALRAHVWARRHGRRHVVLTECTPEIDPLLSAPQLALHRRLARRADGVIAVSARGRERLLAFGVDPARITVSTQPADLAPVRAAAGSGAAAAAGADVGADADPAGAPASVVVLSVARLVPDKNLALLTEVVAALPGVRLQIAGTGFQEDELRALAARLGEPVVFHGAVPPVEMGELYARADVFALVSTFEPFGVAVREAVAAGLPIVCSERAGAAGEVALSGRNALLVEPESAAAVTGALRRLAEDPELRARMGAESRAIDAALQGADVAAFADAIRRAAA